MCFIVYIFKMALLLLSNEEEDRSASFSQCSQLTVIGERYFVLMFLLTWFKLTVHIVITAIMCQDCTLPFTQITLLCNHSLDYLVYTVTN